MRQPDEVLVGLRTTSGPATRRGLLAWGVATAVGLLAGCVSAPGAGGDTARGATPVRRTVDLTDELTFEPETVELPVGGTVVWRNVGAVPHTVTAYAESVPDGAAYFASGGFETEAAARDGYPGGNIEADERYEHQFATPGEYRYFCVPHERAGMRGTIVVR